MTNLTCLRCGYMMTAKPIGNLPRRRDVKSRRGRSHSRRVQGNQRVGDNIAICSECADEAGVRITPENVIIDPQGKHEFAPTVETMEREWRAFRARYGHLPEFAELIRHDIPNKWPERVGRPSWTRRPSTAPFRASEARTAMPQRKG